MRIFIAGCGRSGTTLMQRLMYAFDLYVEPDEHPLSRLYEIESGVVKRNSKGWAELGALRPDTRVIYMVRHPHDVMTSVHPRTAPRYHIDPVRWLAEYRGYDAIRDRDLGLVVRYEDLVADPAEVQRQIEAWGLVRRMDFADVEPIVADSIGRWKRDAVRRTFIESLPSTMHGKIAEFCDEFGYAREGP